MDRDCVVLDQSQRVNEAKAFVPIAKEARLFPGKFFPINALRLVVIDTAAVRFLGSA